MSHYLTQPSYYLPANRRVWGINRQLPRLRGRNSRLMNNKWRRIRGRRPGQMRKICDSPPLFLLLDTLLVARMFFYDEKTLNSLQRGHTSVKVAISLASGICLDCTQPKKILKFSETTQHYSKRLKPPVSLSTRIGNSSIIKIRLDVFSSSSDKNSPSKKTDSDNLKSLFGHCLSIILSDYLIATQMDRILKFQLLNKLIMCAWFA